MNKIWTKLSKSPGRVAKLITGLFVLAFFSLSSLEYLRPVREFLDSGLLSFNIGETRLSVYILVKAIITIVILFWLTVIFSEFAERRIKKIKGVRSNSNKALMIKAFQIIIYFLAFIIGFDVLGIDLTAFAIFGGAIGIGIGFGLQKITSNFISGFILLFEKSVENDDMVELEDGTYGFVRHIAARYTLIETAQGKEIMIPNEDFITNHVTNWTYSNTKGRVDISIGVSYNSDIERAMELILESAREHPSCIADPEPTCFLREFADSSVNFLLLFWVDDVIEGRYKPQSDVMRTIWRKFKENNIVIPYPQRDIHIKNKESLMR